MVICESKNIRIHNQKEYETFSKSGVFYNVFSPLDSIKYVSLRTL